MSLPCSMTVNLRTYLGRTSCVLMSLPCSMTVDLRTSPFSSFHRIPSKGGRGLAFTAKNKEEKTKNHCYIKRRTTAFFFTPIPSINESQVTLYSNSIQYTPYAVQNLRQYQNPCGWHCTTPHRLHFIGPSASVRPPVKQ